MDRRKADDFARRHNQRREPPLSEPLIVPCLFFTGGSIDLIGPIFRVTLWTQIPALGGETEERRIIVRGAAATEVGEDLFDQWRRSFETRHH